MNPQNTFAPVIAAAYQYRISAGKSLPVMYSKRAYGLGLVNLLSRPEPPLGTFLPYDPLFSVIWEPENFAAQSALHENMRIAYFLGIGLLVAECMKWLNLSVDPNRHDDMRATFEPAANSAALELAKNALDPNARDHQKVKLAQRKMATVVVELHKALGQLQCEAMVLPLATPESARRSRRVTTPPTVALADLL